MSEYEHLAPADSGDDKRQKVHSVSRVFNRFWRHHKKLAIALVVFFIVVLSVVLAQPLLGMQISDKRSSLLQSQSTLLRDINRLPSPDGVIIGHQNADARAIVARSQQLGGDIDSRLSDLQLPRSYSFILSAVHIGTSPRDTNALRRSLRDFRQSARAYVLPYTTTFDALLLFFEYSPTVDLQEYDPDSSDTNRRLERLSDGLQETKEALGDIETALAAELSEVIAQAQILQATLEQEHDEQAFIESFSALQEEARVLLIEHHTQLQDNLRSQLHSLSRSTQRTL